MNLYVWKGNELHLKYKSDTPPKLEFLLYLIQQLIDFDSTNSEAFYSTAPDVWDRKSEVWLFHADHGMETNFRHHGTVLLLGTGNIFSFWGREDVGGY